MVGCMVGEEDLVDDSGSGGVGLLLQGVHQHHLLLPSQGSQDGDTVQEELHLASLVLVNLPHMVPALPPHPVSLLLTALRSLWHWRGMATQSLLAGLSS